MTDDIKDADRPAFDNGMEITDSLIRALEARGLALVPKVATAEMLDAAYWAVHDEDAASTWDLMVRAGAIQQAEEILRLVV
jgi:hypothetical protein